MQNRICEDLLNLTLDLYTSIENLLEKISLKKLRDYKNGTNTYNPHLLSFLCILSKLDYVLFFVF